MYKLGVSSLAKRKQENVFWLKFSQEEGAGAEDVGADGAGAKVTGVYEENSAADFAAFKQNVSKIFA